MTDATVNEWFKSPETPMGDIAHMLMALDEKGHVPQNMRESIHKHARNATSTIPSCIGGISTAMASSLSEGGLSDESAASASWGIAALADSMHGMSALEFHFGPYNEFRTEASKAAS